MLKKEVNQTKSNIRRKLLISVLCIAASLAVVVPVMAQTPTDVEGFYMARAPSAVYDTHGVRYTFEYPYWGMQLSQANETISGYLFGFNASSVSGSVVRCGSTTYNATMSRNTLNLVWGTNNVTVATAGTLGVYIKDGCLGSATNGTGTIAGSPVSLVPGWNTLNVTGNGTIAVYPWMDYTLLGSIAGTVGSSRFVLVGPDLVTDLDAGNATIAGVNDVQTGNETRIIAPGWIYSVTGNGTAVITVPVGSSGTAVGVGVNETLTYGATDLVVDAAPGTLTVEISTDRLFQVSGRITSSWWSSTVKLSGRVEGFLVLDNDPWNAKILSSTFVGTEYAYDPVLN